MERSAQRRWCPNLKSTGHQGIYASMKVLCLCVLVVSLWATNEHIAKRFYGCKPVAESRFVQLLIENIVISNVPVNDKPLSAAFDLFLLRAVQEHITQERYKPQIFLLGEPAFDRPARRFHTLARRSANAARKSAEAALLNAQAEKEPRIVGKS